MPDEMFYGQESIRSAFNRTFAWRGFYRGTGVTSAISRLKLHWFRISRRIGVSRANTPVSASALVQICNNKCVRWYVPIFTIVRLKICERKGGKSTPGHQKNSVQHVVCIVLTLKIYELCRLTLAHDERDIMKREIRRRDDDDSKRNSFSFSFANLFPILIRLKFSLLHRSATVEKVLHHRHI